MTIEQGENVLVQFALRYVDAQPIPLVALKSFEVQARQRTRKFKTWRYALGAAAPADMRVFDGIIELELTAAVTAKMRGKIEFHVIPTYADLDYFATLGQTDLVCFKDLLEVVKC